MDTLKKFVTKTDIASLRNLLCDLTNDSDSPKSNNRKSASFGNDDADRDVILLDKYNDFVPDSVSPSRKHGVTRFFGSKASPDLEIIGERNVFGATSDMCKTSEQVYNYEMSFKQSSVKRNTQASPKIHAACDDFGLSTQNGQSSAFKAASCSSGGKLPHYGPRRFVQPNSKYGEYVSHDKPKFHVGKSEIQNYKAICSLASSEFKDEYAVEIGGVHCTFRSLGESLMQGGVVNNFVIAVFCRHLFLKNNAHPDISKRHYFFSNIGENLMLHPDDANQGVLERAFNRKKKARPIPNMNMLFFPILYDNHWFVFIVDIKDHLFVFLDSYYSKDDEYQQHVKETIIPSFQVQWDRYVQFAVGEEPRDMKFDEYEVVYPTVPHQGLDNLVDCGIFAMLFMEYWISPRTQLTSIFTIDDIPRIRVKIANELMFLPYNIGLKSLVIGYNKQDD